MHCFNVTMFCKTFAILFLLYSVSDIEGVLKFRPDYIFSEQAGGWLKLHLVPSTWSDARILCHAEGSILASPLSRQLRDTIVHMTQMRSIHTIFTGVHTTYAKGVYASVEGVPLPRLLIRWASGEPNNFENSESCLAMVTANNGTMRDVKCSSPLPFVCYKKMTQPMVITECGTIDTEYNLDARTGKCYKFHRHGLTWSRAYMTCMAEGAHLAVINSEEEFVVLRELYAKNPDSVIVSSHPFYVALGFSDPNDGGSWITIHGQTLEEAGFERWHPGEPNNASQPVGELCGIMYRSNGDFNDAPCYLPLAFICEKKPESFEDLDDNFIISHLRYDNVSKS